MSSEDVPGSDANDDPTLQFYSKEAPVYTASGKGGVSRHLAEFLQRLPSGARILELGCGGGRDAEAMIAAGFDVEPTDGTPEIAARAEERLGRPVRVMRFEELSAEQSYDAVWANASLLHVPRVALPGVLGRVRTALRPGSLHYASFKGGDHEGRDAFGRYFNYLSREDLVECYRQSGGWETVSIVEYLGGGYQSTAEGPMDCNYGKATCLTHCSRRSARRCCVIRFNAAVRIRSKKLDLSGRNLVDPGNGPDFS